MSHNRLTTRPEWPLSLQSFLFNAGFGLMLLMLVAGCAALKSSPAPERKVSIKSEYKQPAQPQKLPQDITPIPKLAKPAQSRDITPEKTSAKAQLPESQAQALPEERPTNSYYHFLEAQIQIKKGKLDEGIVCLKKALSGDPDSLYLEREIVSVYLQQQNYEGALKIVEKILTKVPDDPETLTIYGRIKHQLNDLEAAQKAYIKVLAQNPKKSQIYLLLGQIYLQEKNYQKAEQVYTDLTSHFADSYAGYFFLGKIHAEQGKTEAAEDAFKKTLQLAPDLEEPRFELIKLFQKLGRTQQIIDTYNELLKQNPQNNRASMALALLYHNAGNRNNAAEILKKLGTRTKSDIEIIRTVVRHYIDTKNYADALIILRGMFPSAPDNSELHYVTGVAYDGHKDKRMAITHFKRVRSDSKFYQSALIHIAFLLQDQGKIDEAISFLENAMRKNPENPEFYLYLGTFYEEKEEFSKAIQQLRKGLKLDPDNPKLHFRLGVAYDKLGRKDDSIQAMKSVIKLDPKDPRALNYLGYTYADLGRNLDEAEQLILQALKYKPDDGYITDSLGWVYFKKGLFQKAIKYLERAAKLVPDDPIILEHLGDAYLKVSKKKEALDFYQRSLKNKKKDKAELERKIQELKTEDL